MAIKVGGACCIQSSRLVLDSIDQSESITLVTLKYFGVSFGFLQSVWTTYTVQFFAVEFSIVLYFAVRVYIPKSIWIRVGSMNTKLWYFQLFCSKIFQFPGIVTLWALLFFGSGSSGPSSADSNCGGHSQEKKVKDWPKMMDPRTN